MENGKEKFEGSSVRTITHQSMIGCLLTRIAVYLREKGQCGRVICAPAAVFLEEAGEEFVQPDILVVCDVGKLDEEGCHGAPDWVIEVVSLDSRRQDYGSKLGLYIEAGVREYWVVDPEKKIIVTYYPEQADAPVIHAFGDVIKPDIFEDLTIDSGELSDFLYEKTWAGTKAEGQAEPVFYTDTGSAFPAGRVEDKVEYSSTGDDTGDDTGGDRGEDAVPGRMGDEKGNGEAVQDNPGAAAAAEPEMREKHRKADPGRLTSVEEVKEYIKDNFADLVRKKNIGQLLRTSMGALKGKAESKLVSEAVMELCR